MRIGLRKRGVACVLLCSWLLAVDAVAVDPDGDGLEDVDERARIRSVPFGDQQLVGDLADGARMARPADLDGDGDLDLLVAAELADEVAWYENLDGQGGFGSRQTISSAADGPRAVFAADLDADTDDDGWSDGEEVAFGSDPLDPSEGAYFAGPALAPAGVALLALGMALARGLLGRARG